MEEAGSYSINSAQSPVSAIHFLDANELTIIITKYFAFLVFQLLRNRPKNSTVNTRIVQNVDASPSKFLSGHYEVLDDYII